MEKPKIAFVLPALDLGGAQRVVTSLANTLVENYEVLIITFIKVKPFYKLNNNIKLFHCVKTIKPSSNIFEALRNNYILFKQIQSTVKTENVKLLIGFLTSANTLSILAARSCKIPVIISERNNPHIQKAPKIWQLLRYITYPFANYVVVQTQTIKSFYVNKIKNERLVILPNPIAADLTLKRNNKQNTTKDNIILNAGRLTDQKGQDLLIRAFSRTKQHDNWKLVIAGDGPNRAKYENLIRELHLVQEVLLLGNYDNIDELYNKSKIFAFSSNYEGFPNALIEAMYFGLACVSTDCPTGPSELINDGDNGYLIPLNDEKEMAKKLEFLMNDEHKRQDFGRKGAQSVERFEMNNVVMKWKVIINNCLDD